MNDKRSLIPPKMVRIKLNSGVFILTDNASTRNVPANRCETPREAHSPQKKRGQIYPKAGTILDICLLPTIMGLSQRDGKVMPTGSKERVQKSFTGYNWKQTGWWNNDHHSKLSPRRSERINLIVTSPCGGNDDRGPTICFEKVAPGGSILTWTEVSTHPLPSPSRRCSGILKWSHNIGKNR